MKYLNFFSVILKGRSRVLSEVHDTVVENKVHYFLIFLFQVEAYSRLFFCIFNSRISFLGPPRLKAPVSASLRPVCSVSSRPLGGGTDRTEN